MNKDNIFAQITQTEYGANNKLSLNWERSTADYKEKLGGREFLDKINQAAPLNLINEVLQEFSEDVRDEMSVLKDALYGSAIPDYTVVTRVYEVSKKLEKTKQIPNIVIMGGPGSGKTTLAKKLAGYLCRKLSVQEEDRFIMKSASDLKGAHIGQTAIRVFDMLKTASLNNQIVYIDEAYHLQEDEFGREAVDFLLPVMSGDRDVIEKQVKKDKELTTEKFSFSKDGNGIPPIWLGGYEHEMRKLLSQNQGLYRRLVKISLAAPSAADLYQCLLHISKDNPVCLELFLEPANAKEIRQYFAWGMRPEYMDYFAAYAGVEVFYETAEIYLTERLSVSEREKMLFKILKEKREEIKRQHKAILTDVQKAEFEVETDISVTLSDVICSEKMKKELSEIVNSLYFCAVNPHYGIAAPKGAILTGPSGTGKTYIAKALAGEIQKRLESDEEQKGLKIGFIEISALELEKREKLTRLFTSAEEYDTCILFIDELDVLAGKNADDSVSELLLQLLKEMDGFKEGKNIFVIAAAKSKKALQPALLRPGRLEYCFELKLPALEERTEFLKKYLGELSFWKRELTEEEIGIGNEEDFDFFAPWKDDLKHPQKYKAELLKKYATYYAWNTMGYSAAELKALVGRAWIQFYQIEGQEDFSLNKSINRFFGKLDTVYEDMNAGKTNYYVKKKSWYDFQKRRKELYIEEELLLFRRAVHQMGHFFFQWFAEGQLLQKDISLFYEEEDAVLEWKEKYPLDSEKLQERILVCLGGRIMEEVFFGEMISVEAMQDVTRAIEYAREILLLYGERIGEFSAEEYVQETLHSGGLAMLYGGWQKEQLVSLAYALYEKERVAYKTLENHMISLERPWKEEGKRFRRKYLRLLEGYSADSFSSALVLVEAEGRRNNIRKTLKQCGIEAVDGCDVQTAYQKLSEEKVSYDLIIFDYEDFVYAGRLYSFLEELFDLIEQKQGKTLVCVPLGEYLKKLSGGVKITREGTREEHYKERQVTLADGEWWYIPDRDMTKDVKRELAQLPGRRKEIAKKNILQ